MRGELETSISSFLIASQTVIVEIVGSRVVKIMIYSPVDLRIADGSDSISLARLMKSVFWESPDMVATRVPKRIRSEIPGSTNGIQEVRE